MRRQLWLSALPLLMVVGTSDGAAAQDAPPTAVRPGFHVTFGTISALEPRSATDRIAAPAPLLKRRQLDRPWDIQVYGGVSSLSSGDAVDDFCNFLGDFIVNVGLTDYSCGGEGGGTAPMFGGDFIYRYPVTERFGLQFHGGVGFATEHTIQLDLDAEVEFEQDVLGFNLSGGYRFNSQHVYGGAGVELNRLYVGVILGRAFHSGQEFVREAITENGQIVEENDEQRDRSGSAGLFGIRAQYGLGRGLYIHFDYSAYGLGNLYEELDLDIPSQYQIDVTNKVVLIGVAWRIGESIW